MERLRESRSEFKSERYPETLLTADFYDRTVAALKRNNAREFRDSEIGNFEDLMKSVEGDS